MEAINQGVHQIRYWRHQVGGLSKAWKSLLSGSDDDNVLSLRADTSLRSIKLIDLELIHPKIWYSMFGTQIMIKQTKGGPK